jgi:hypothetical protein
MIAAQCYADPYRTLDLAHLSRSQSGDCLASDDLLQSQSLLVCPSFRLGVPGIFFTKRLRRLSSPAQELKDFLNLLSNDGDRSRSISLASTIPINTLQLPKSYIYVTHSATGSPLQL